MLSKPRCRPGIGQLARSGQHIGTDGRFSHVSLKPRNLSADIGEQLGRSGFDVRNTATAEHVAKELTRMGHASTEPFGCGFVLGLVP